MGLLILFLSCSLKFLHDFCFISFDNATFEELSPHPTLWFFFFKDISDACITKGFTVSALVQIQEHSFSLKKTHRPKLSSIHPSRLLAFSSFQTHKPLSATQFLLQNTKSRSSDPILL